MDSRKFLSQDERSYIETFCTERIETDTRNSVMILTALHSGCRPQELLNLTWDDINILNGEIFVKSLKDGAPRAVVVPKVVRDGLSKLKAMSPDKPFNISYQRMAEIWNDYRPTKQKTLRSLRHSFAMRAYERTKDIRFVQYAMGHKSISNTMVYLQYSYSAQEFKKLMNVR